MQKLIMENKCNFNPNFNNIYKPHISEGPNFRGRYKMMVQSAYQNVQKGVEISTDIFVRRPVAEKSATGLLGLVNKIKNYAKSYVKNIKHTYEHKIIFALIEKEVFGSNSIDSITHDLDKLVLYALGFPKSFVSEFHRKHSEHHTESGKKMNLRSMVCDNIASSPEFKPEKQKTLREHYKTSKSLQDVKGLRKMLEACNYGENLDFNQIKNKKQKLLLFI